MAMLGLFDISQRSKAIANYLSLTIPRALWEGMQEGLDTGCLTLGVIPKGTASEFPPGSGNPLGRHRRYGRFPH